MDLTLVKLNHQSTHFSFRLLYASHSPILFVIANLSFFLQFNTLLIFETPLGLNLKELLKLLKTFSNSSYMH